MKQIRKYKNMFPLIYFSNGVAIVFAFLCKAFFIPSSKDEDFGILLVLALAFSWLIQTWLFKIKKLKESQFVDHKWYKKTYKLTPQQLDSFTAYNYRKSSYIKLGIVALTVLHPRGPDIAPGIFLACIIIGFVTKMYLVRVGKLKAPKGLYKISGSPLKQEFKSPFQGIDTANQLGSGITTLRS